MRTAPPPYAEAWEEQRRWAFGTALEGAWRETITSEPGSGGDVMKTRPTSQVTAADGPYRLSGQKHFGSGSGVTSFMVTTAVAEGEETLSWFYLELRGVPWDGSRGVTLSAPWDAPGMRAAQSHALRFEDFPARRTAWPDALPRTIRGHGGFVPCLFTAVTIGILDAAVHEAHALGGGETNSALTGAWRGRTPGRTTGWPCRRMKGWCARPKRKAASTPRWARPP